MQKILRASLLVSWLVLGWARVDAQTSTNAAPAAGTTNAASAGAPTGIALANVVTSAIADTNSLTDIQTSLSADQTAANVARDTPVFAQEIDRQQSDNAQLFASNPSLSNLRTAQASWQSLSDHLGDSRTTVTTRISQLDKNVTSLGEMTKKWQATLSLAKASAAPPAIISRINEVIASIAQTTKAITTLRARILSAQISLAEQESRVNAGLKAVQEEQQNALKRLFTQDNVPVWSMFSQTAGPATAPNRSFLFGPQFSDLSAYVALKFSTLVIHLLVFIALALLLFWVRQEVQKQTQDDPALQRSAQVFQIPMAMAAVLALLLSSWLYPQAPPLFWAVLGAAALVPAVIILRRLIEPALFPILYAMVLAYFVDQVRHVAAAQPALGRSVFLLETVAAALFIIWLLKSKRLHSGQHQMLERGVRYYSWFALVIFLGTIAAQVLGYTRLSYLLGNAMLESSYLAVILYAVVRIADGLILGSLKVWPLSLLGMVRQNESMLSRNASQTVRGAAFLAWIWIALEMFSVRAALWKRASSLLHHQVGYGYINLSLAPILLFGITIYVTLLLSRFVRFILEQEVYPNLKLGPGVPYATSTMVHYSILTLGTLFALAAVHVDLSKYSVLAGALGVGLGFGLQNIMNNFVSGIILLFERPIKVGDVIQVDTAVGTVESIGIRASVIRITNGSEIILPNGNLISNQVTNWTFSNRRRMIDLPVSVAPKSDPQRVMGLLIETAKAHPLVLKDPPPQALLTSFTAAALSFEIHAWTNNHEVWNQTRSDLSLAIASALAKEDIAIS